jgi:hypothetical protein
MWREVSWLNKEILASFDGLCSIGFELFVIFNVSLYKVNLNEFQTQKILAAVGFS